MPKIFYWVNVRRFRRSTPSVDPNFIIKPLSHSRTMLGIIVLHKSAGNFFLKKGQKSTSKKLAEKWASMVPSKIQMPVGPLLLIPDQTCTLVGCLGHGLGCGFSPSFLQQYHQWQSNWILDSSLQITLSKLSLRLAQAHSNRFCSFAFRINWQ